MRFDNLGQWLAWQETLHPKSIDLGLGRVLQVFQAMGPWPTLPLTLTVAGTNGKGSCVALLDSILRAQGYRVGTYTSPHLLSYSERIRIDGINARDEDLCEVFERIDQARGDTTLSFFEFGTLAALDLFIRNRVDVQVLEVGLGGRLDAVNLLDPDGALIASIDIDHVEWLGSNRSDIALEKAGILRANKPAVIGDPNPPESLLRYAQQHGIQLTCQGVDFHFQRQEQHWSWSNDETALEQLPLPALVGDHQYLNAAAVIQLLQKVSPALPVTESAIREGLRQVRLLGRLQLFEGRVPVIVDVAHNSQSVGILAEHLQQQFPGRVIHAVFAMMRDKNIPETIARMRNLVKHWYAAPLSLQRAAPVEELITRLREAGVESAQGDFSSAAEAFAAATRNAQNDELIVVFGTFPLVAEVLSLIDE
jgi:dihydrofolate synthase/folylpolyglutamate synthase